MNEIIRILSEKNKTISTMESCTGGALVNEITNIEGASTVLKFSAVTYSNEYKIKMGVSKEIIDKYTVYSIETAKEMSKKISDYTNSNYGIGITGQINKTDPNNVTDENDKIYISIYEKDNDKYYTESLKAFLGTREENKKEIIKSIERKLLEIIK